MIEKERKSYWQDFNCFSMPFLKSWCVNRCASFHVLFSPNWINNTHSVYKLTPPEKKTIERFPLHLVIINHATEIDVLKIFQFKLAKSRLCALFVFNFTSAYLRFPFVLCVQSLFSLLLLMLFGASSTSEYSTWLRISVREMVVEFMADEHTKFSGIS